MNNAIEIFHRCMLCISIIGIVLAAFAMLCINARAALAKITAFIAGHPVQNMVLMPCVLTFFAYGSTKPEPPPPVIVEQGIKLTRHFVDKNAVSLEWSTEDERIIVGTDVFQVQRRTKAFPFKGGWSAWQTIGETTSTNLTIEGFTLDRNTQYRIAVEKEGIE